MDKTNNLKYDSYTFDDELIKHISDHQTWISFDSDAENYAFQEWLESEGMIAFNDWKERVKDDTQ